MTRLLSWLGLILALVSVGQPSAALADESWVDVVLRVTGISVGPGQLRGPEAAGSLWVADVDGAAPVRWTSGADFRSPVFAPGNAGLYALQGETLVRVASAGAAPEIVHTVPDLEKLLGADPQASDDLLVLLRDANAPLAKLSLENGALIRLPFDPTVPEQANILAQVRGSERRVGDTRVMLRKQREEGLTRAREWTDVLVQKGNDPPRKISQGNGTDCSQPALSPDASRVAFVRARR